MSTLATFRSRAAPVLDPAEEHVFATTRGGDARLFLRCLAPRSSDARPPRAVLYVHGATFPSALSIAHRFDGWSWRDALLDAGFAVWGLDFRGFGSSEPYPEMDEPADRHPALGDAASASHQIERAIGVIRERSGVERVSLLAHSWGTIAAGLFATQRPELVDRMVLFGPIARRTTSDEPQRLPAWRVVSLEDQWRRFIADVPNGEAHVLSARHFAEWSEAYLDSDPESRTREPASVKIPCGPSQDVAYAFAGRLPYDPGMIVAPVAIIRGEWDSLSTDADARWLFDALKASPDKRDIKIGRATHLMHLEATRSALYAESIAFLKSGG